MIRILRHLLAVVLLLPEFAGATPFARDALNPFPISNLQSQISNSSADPSTGKSATRPRAKAPAKPSPAEKFSAAFEEYRAYLIPGLGALGALVLIVGVLWWRRGRAQHRLPEFAVAPRFGGGHGAGVGGIISFADPTVPPSAQRQLLKDSLSSQ